MNETAEHERPEPEKAPEPVLPEAAAVPPPAPSPAAPPRRNPAMVLSMVGLLLLFIGFVWLALRLDAIEAQRPAVDPAQLAALDRRIAALEQRPATDLRPLEGRISALERRPAGAAAQDLSPLEARLAALEQRPAPAPVVAPDPRLDALAARLNQLAAATTTLAAEEAALRLAFPEAAQKAEAASRVVTSGQPVLERMWAEVSALVTVKDGARVLSGPPAAPALERAREAVVAGDFAGAVKALDGLDAGAAKEMAGWRARAEKLVAARAALAKAGG